VLPTEHVAGVRGRKPAAAGEPPQHSAPHLGGDGRERLRRQILSGSELDLAVGAALQYPVDDTAMGVDAAVQCRAEAVDKADRPEARVQCGPGTGLLQVTLDHTQEDLEHRAEGLGFAL